MLNLGVIGPPHASGPDALREAIQNRQLEQVRRLGWPRLERADLAFGPLRGQVTHWPSGRLFRLHAGELDDLLYSSAAAYFEREDGTIGFLEDPPAGAPRTVAELQERQRR